MWFPFPARWVSNLLLIKRSGIVMAVTLTWISGFEHRWNFINKNVPQLIFSDLRLAHQRQRHVIKISAQRRQQNSRGYCWCPCSLDVSAFSSVPGVLYHFDKRTQWDLHSGFPSLKSAWQDGKSHCVWFSRMIIWGIHLLPFFGWLENNAAENVRWIIIRDELLCS